VKYHLPCLLLHRHTHERVDQFFSCLSRYLNRTDARTVDELVAAIKAAFTKPVPNVYELEHVLDMQEYLKNCLPRGGDLKEITRPHQFCIRPEPNAEGPVKSHIVCKRWSDTPESAPCHLLQSLPENPPRVKAGRPIFNQGDGGCSFESAKRFAEFKNHVKDIQERRLFSDEYVAKWDETFRWLEDLQQLESSPFSGFWPLSPKDLLDHLTDVERWSPSQLGLAPRPEGLASPIPEAMVSIADEAARIQVEIEDHIDFQGVFLSGESAETDVGFRQVYDARKGNLVVLDNSRPDEGDDLPDEYLGDWERLVTVGYVRERIYPEGMTEAEKKKRSTEPESLELALCEPWVTHHSTGEAVCPLWLYKILQEREGRTVKTSWEDVKHLPWKEVQAIPYATYQACYKSSWTNTGDKIRDPSFMGTDVPAIVRFDLQKANKNCKTLLQVQPYGQLHYTCVLEDKTERARGAKLPEEALARIAMSMRQVCLRKTLKALHEQALI
jgi:hypothetical protein